MSVCPDSVLLGPVSLDRRETDTQFSGRNDTGRLNFRIDSALFHFTVRDDSGRSELLRRGRLTQQRNVVVLAALCAYSTISEPALQQVSTTFDAHPQDVYRDDHTAADLRVILMNFR